jgi:D-tyrosyl-tRNA(Tyr) deacylase
MPNDWILDVLDDLRNFSDANALPELAEAIERARSIANRELRTQHTPGVSLIHASFAGDTPVIGSVRRHS